MNVKIIDVATYIPGNRKNVLKNALQYSLSEEFVESKLGCKSLPQIESAQETSDLAVSALQTLFSKHEGLKNRIGILIVVTQNPDGFGLPHTSAIVHGKMQLASDVAAFDVSLGCSGYVYGLSIIKSFMQDNGIENGIL